MRSHREQNCTVRSLKWLITYILLSSLSFRFCILQIAFDVVTVEMSFESEQYSVYLIGFNLYFYDYSIKHLKKQLLTHLAFKVCELLKPFDDFQLLVLVYCSGLLKISSVDCGFSFNFENNILILKYFKTYNMNI